MELEFITLDVFTTTPYEGNPLAVVKVPASYRPSLTQARKQQVAKEFNLSETLFLHEKTEEDQFEEDIFEVDIFTTSQELPFAGHPTIGCASYVLESLTTASCGTLVTKAGLIDIRREERGVSAGVPHNVHVHPKQSLLDSRNLWIEEAQSEDERLLVEAETQGALVSIVKGMAFLLVQLPTLNLLSRAHKTRRTRDLMPLLDEEWREGFVGRYYYVLDPATTNVDESKSERPTVKIRTRMIETTIEDPATGSAACALGCYLAQTGLCIDGKNIGRYEMTQGVEMGRKSVIGVEVKLKDQWEKETVPAQQGPKYVRLSGSAVCVMKGTIYV